MMLARVLAHTATRMTHYSNHSQQHCIGQQLRALASSWHPMTRSYHAAPPQVALHSPAAVLTSKCHQHVLTPRSKLCFHHNSHYWRSHICHSAAAVFPGDNSHWLNGNGGADAHRSYSPEPQTGSKQGESVMSLQEADQMKRELHSLNVAITVNILICLAKVWVHLISGSSAMLAEALHSVADILNQVLLRIGVLQAMRAPTDKHPYGYMRDRFVWSLISAVGIFFLGSGASVLHGIHTLAETRVVEAATWSYIEFLRVLCAVSCFSPATCTAAVLGVSGLLEGYSLWVATRCVVEGARSRGMALFPYIASGVDPTTVAVMLEDGGAVAGLLIAGICTALTHWTGNAMFDALGSIMVGGLLGLIAVFLVQRNRDLLLGRSMSPKEIEEVLGHLRKDPVVSFVTDTKTEELGPRVFRFKAEVGFNADALVDRYLKRSGPLGRDKLVALLEAALAAERASRLAGQQSRALEMVLRGYGRDIISSVGLEVDRIESEIQAINPGIRYVDLETDRGRSTSTWVAGGSKSPSPLPDDSTHMHADSTERLPGLSTGAAEHMMQHHADATGQQHEDITGSPGNVR